jgi:hypothetical protein
MYSALAKKKSDVQYSGPAIAVCLKDDYHLLFSLRIYIVVSNCYQSERRLPSIFQPTGYIQWSAIVV